MGFPGRIRRWWMARVAKWPLTWKKTARRNEASAQKSWQRWAEERVEKERSKAADVISRFTRGQVEATRGPEGHEIHVRHIVSDELLYNMADADHLWDYIAEEMGHELGRQLRSMRFGAIMEGRALVSRRSL